jgi:cell division protein FtsA
VIASIIGPRFEEICLLARNEIRKVPSPELLASGVVLTGGGCLIPGAAELAERIFDLPVRIGRPTGVTGMSHLVVSAADAAAVGLIAHARESAPSRMQSHGVFRRVSSRIGQVLSEFL